MIKLCILTPLLLLCSCTITTINISQKTALENQLLGEMAPLSEEELLIASVRGGSGPAPLPAMAPAVAARRRQLFNRDDTNEYKVAQCAGEALNSRLVSRPCSLRQAPDYEKRLVRIIEEENHDRKILVNWMIANDLTLTPADRPQIERIYHDLLLRNSPTSTLSQTSGGIWSSKSPHTQTEKK